MIGFGLRLGKKRSPQAAIAGALDAYTQDVLGAWSSSRRLSTSYTGPLFKIRESSANSELDIYSADDFYTDEDSITGFVGSNSAFIKTLYNQVGTWPNFSNSTAASQMRLVDTGSIDSINNRVACYNQKDVVRSLSFSPQTAGNSWSAIMVLEPDSDYAAQYIAAGSSTYWLGFHSTNDRYYLNAPSPLSTSLVQYDNLHKDAGWSKFKARPVVLGIKVKNGLQEMYLNGWKCASTSIVGNFPLSISHFGFSNVSSISWKGDMSDFIIFNSADFLGFNSVMAEMIDTYAAKQIVVCAGDSLSLGTPTSYANFLHQTTDYGIFLSATIGHRVDQVASTLNGAVNNGFSPRFNGNSKKNICVCLCGVNDLIQGASVETVKTRLSSLWLQQRTAGFKVVASTLTGSQNQSSLTQEKLIELNQWIRTANTEYDSLIDAGASSIIGVGQHTNLTYFQVDYLHLTTAGYEVYATLAKPAIDAVS